MPTLRHLTALALARALLAGPPDAAGLASRLRACLGQDATWCDPLAERCARLPPAQWQRLTPRLLARVVEDDDGYQQAWRADDHPHARHLLLGAQAHMHAAPAALQRCALPLLPHTQALARWLGLTDGGLWRLTKPSAWQRRTALVDQHYRCQVLAKRSGGWRLLEVPQPYLMALQRRVLGGLLAQLPPHPAACGVAGGRSVVDHARAHAGQPVLLKFDLRDFFSSVRAARVQALFDTLGYAEPVARAFTALCTTATPEPVLQRLHEDGGLTWPQRQRLRDPHLPQGAPTSPALASLCALALDRRLAGLALSLGAHYTRYADDLVLSGPLHLRAAMPRIAAWVAAIAHDEGFAVHHRKTRCQAAGQRQTVCNIVVNQHPNLPRPDFDRLKAVLHLCRRDGPAMHNRDGLPDWHGHLHGRVAWAAQVNPGKAQRLQRLLQHIDWSR